MSSSQQLMLGETVATAAPVTDPYFNYVSLLLHGDGTNGAQNNTFLDSSTNNFTITQPGTNSNAQGTFSPYGANWSNYFDGAGDYLQAAYNAAFNLAGGSFTVEAYIYITGLFTANQDANRVGCIMDFGPSTTNTGWEFVIDQTNNTILFSVQGVSPQIVASYTFAQNAWYHVAVVRNNTTNAIYVNGVSLTLTTNTYTGVSTTSGNITVGSARRFTGYNHDFLGYISNVRVVKGAALYTSNFTPSTTPLTAVTNTSLLTCQSNRFVDNSANNFTITKNGDVSVQRFSPFSPTAEYSTSTIGGSVWFNGTGGYLQFPQNSAFTFSSNFTVEGWFYTSKVTGTQPIFTTDASVTYPGLLIQIETATLYAKASSAGASFDIYNASLGTVVPNTWYHFAVSKSSSTTRFFLNGALVNTSTTATALRAQTSTGRIGAHSTNLFSGYVSDIRTVTGASVYSAAFTPPTAPLGSTGLMSMLLSMTNAGIYDNAEMNDLTTFGNAQISTSVVKYGTGSMAFDGTGDGLISVNTNISLINANFTWECWVNFSSLASNPCLIAVSVDTVNRNLLYFDATNGIRYAVARGGADQISIQQGSTSGWSTGTWYHVALVRNGNVYTIYRDGISVASGTSTYTQSILAAGVTLGYSNAPGSFLYFTGYLDDVRITKGYARYTANFTPPTEAFPNY